VSLNRLALAACSHNICVVLIPFLDHDRPNLGDLDLLLIKRHPYAYDAILSGRTTWDLDSFVEGYVGVCLDGDG